ncbi:MAG TPA: cysteine synthase family protein [Acidobacteriota bacterium]|nr:cysteine synthase family protein [Acidobacteriota bacterium]
MTTGRAGTLLHSIVDAIGCTPMVELHRLVAKLGLNGRIFAKLEYLNPGFSKKDRIALEMIREAKASGQLKEGQTVVELTSGNTGTGLAIVCRALGHPFIAVMSRGNTVERARMMRALGAEVVLVDQAVGSIPNQVSGEDLALVEEKTQELVRERQAFRANQFELEANRLAHERHTGPEIWEQTGGQVDVFVDFAGTGGSFAGITRYLRSRNPRLRAYLVEPASAPALAGGKISNPSHKIQGGGYSMSRLPLLDQDLVTDYLQVTDDEAICGARMLAEVEGIFGGFSAGSHLSAAVRLLQERERGASIAFLVCDSGLKYLSTDLWEQM